MARNAVHLSLALMVAASAVAATTPVRTEAQDTQSQILARLNANPDFRAQIPPGHRGHRLSFAGSVLPGPLVWEGDPKEPAIVPRGLASAVVRNCQYGNVPISSGSLEGRFRETQSLTISNSVTVGTSLGIEVGWPGVTVGTETSVEVSTTIGSTSESSEELVFSQGYSTPVPPRTEFDIQLQMLEQRIDGQPFSFDAELRGNARIDHRPIVQWVQWRGRYPQNVVNAGFETSPTSGVTRALSVCRAWHGRTRHPGKLIMGRCNYSFYREEHYARSFEVLVAHPRAVRWRSRDAFESDYDADTVRAGNSSAVQAGHEVRDDRYGGRLLVCRARHEGGVHPGKVVINHCMFGYGGSEIQVWDYQVLTRAPSGTLTVNLQDYLAPEDRSFRVEGSFDGARSMAYSLVYGTERPVDERVCPSAPIPASAPRDSPALLDASVVRQTEAGASGPTPLAPAAPGGRTAPNPARPDGTAPLTYEPTIEGRVYVRAEIDDEATPIPRLAAFRLIRLDRPHQFGADVLAVQEALNAAGWPLRADGFFGPRTDAALRHFQRAHGLRPDGIAGPMTLDRLGL